jgi:hypothetical protein
MIARSSGADQSDLTVNKRVKKRLLETVSFSVGLTVNKNPPVTNFNLTANNGSYRKVGGFVRNWDLVMQVARLTKKFVLFLTDGCLKSWLRSQSYLSKSILSTLFLH